MSKSRLEIKVGLFIFVCLVVLAGLLINFSKSVSLFSRTYNIRLRTTNVGGIIPGAKVLLAGVPIGTVTKASLVDGGKSVVVDLQIYQQFPIYSDARFTIEQAGFLGDQYVFVKPMQNTGPLLKDGDEVKSEEPFNLQEAARSAMGLIQRVDQTVQRINEAVVRVDTTLLSESTLTNLAGSISNLHQVSERALGVVDGVGHLVDSNAPAVTLAVSNVVTFTDQLHSVSNLTKFANQLNQVADDLQGLVSSNRADVTASVKNVEESTALLKSMLNDVYAGKGMAGGLLRDDRLRQQMSETMANLTTLSSNLNRFGLLYKPKPVKTNSYNAASALKDVYPKARQ